MGYCAVVYGFGYVFGLVVLRCLLIYFEIAVVIVNSVVVLRLLYRC